MSAHIFFLNSLKELRKRDKLRGMSSILAPFCNVFYTFNNTETRMLDAIHHMTFK